MTSAHALAIAKTLELDLEVRDGSCELVAEGANGTRRLAVPVEVLQCDGSLRARIHLNGYLRGIAAFLAEDRRDRGEAVDFVGAARTVMPTVEPRSFVAGQATAGRVPFVTDFSETLVVAYQIELDHGYRTLTAAQVEDWGIHPERLEKAALSILFHQSWNREVEAAGGGIERWSFPDRRAAARLVAVDLLDYHRARHGLWIAVPAPDVLLVADRSTETALNAFEERVAAELGACQSPLSDETFRCVDGHLDRAGRRVPGG